MPSLYEVWSNMHQLFLAVQNVYHTAQKWTGPSKVQFHPLKGRRMQSEERFSFSFHLMLFFSADDKNIPKGICLPMTIRPDIFTHFANKPIQFYIAIFILKETLYIINAKVNV